MAWLRALGPAVKVPGVWRDEKEVVWGMDNTMGEWSPKVKTRAHYLFVPKNSLKLLFW